MGIDPIGYKPWTGQRTAKRDRILVIARTLFMNSMKSKWIILLLVLGYIGVWAFPIILYSLSPHEELDGATMASQMGGGMLFVFSVLLASLVCSDSISEDLRSNSFVLYFSRAIKKESYLAGKIGGIFFMLALFCLVPPVIMGVALLGTQSGTSYVSGLGVLGLTVLAGFVATIFLIPFSVMVSSFTKRKSYAAIGTFMTFFVLSIVGGIFSTFDANWNLISPGSMLSYFYSWLFGEGLPYNISGPLLAVLFSAFIIVPTVLVMLRVQRMAEGK
jgi:ABC-type transport system involved in multi-copper enzyme maturation permease subunit